ncbi:hypothetical protein [Undibacterium sp.]|uniref:hypothetical protein n=1 Tax=Undibacterium sp. TaxID=1914977 RepID=UPI0025D84F6D|nr:hypothetical protein [Undibacterium sp.]
MAIADKLPISGTLFTAGLLLCIFSSLSRFESIKGLGIEAKMAALDNKLYEADRNLDHIQNTVGLMADISFQIMARIGRWDGSIPKTEAIVIADGLAQQLRELGATEDEINRRMAPWHESNLFDLTQPIYNGLLEFSQLRNQHLTAETHQLTQPLSADNPEMTRINEELAVTAEFNKEIAAYRSETPVQFIPIAEEFINKIPFASHTEKRALHNKLREFIDDARFYMDNNKFKSKERWINSLD